MRWLASEFMNDIPETCKANGVPGWNDPRPVSVRLFECSAKLEREVNNLRAREKLCETMDKAEKLALIRALQEIRDAVGLLGDGVSPREIVAAVRALANNRIGYTEK